jgi:hypothetical protein
MSSSPHQVPRCQANRPLAATSTFTLGVTRTDTAGRAFQDISRMSRGRPPRTHPAPTIPVPLVVPALGDVEAQPGLNRQRKLRT